MTNTIIGFDADQDCSHVAKHAYDKGARWVARYLKNLHAAEVAALHAAGLSILLIWETTAKRALSGLAGGIADGQAAARMAQALGAPAGVAIAGTADLDVGAGDEQLVDQYISGFARGLGTYKPVFYGNGLVCNLALARKVTPWLAGGSGMHDTKAFLASGKAVLVQDVGDKRNLALGISIDSDVSMVEDFGQWAPAAVAQPAPPVAPDPVTAAVEELQKALTAAGYYKGEVDGLWGPMTSSAVTVWRHAPR
jgi:hypothetical protein